MTVPQVFNSRSHTLMNICFITLKKSNMPKSDSSDKVVIDYTTAIPKEIQLSLSRAIFTMSRILPLILDLHDEHNRMLLEMILEHNTCTPMHLDQK